MWHRSTGCLLAPDGGHRMASLRANVAVRSRPPQRGKASEGIIGQIAKSLDRLRKKETRPSHCACAWVRRSLAWCMDRAVVLRHRLT